MLKIHDQGNQMVPDIQKQCSGGDEPDEALLANQKTQRGKSRDPKGEDIPRCVKVVLLLHGPKPKVLDQSGSSNPQVLCTPKHFTYGRTS